MDTVILIKLLVALAALAIPVGQCAAGSGYQGRHIRVLYAFFQH